MESYENLRLNSTHKIPKLSLIDRLFKRNKISQKDLEFLDEKYPQIPHDLEELNPIAQPQFQDSFEQPLEEDCILTDPVCLEAEEKEAILNLNLTQSEIPFKYVLVTFVYMAAVLLLLVPKIYIRNNIYYASRNIIQLQAQIDSLQEENKHIKKQLEDIKFKNLTHELDF